MTGRASGADRASRVSRVHGGAADRRRQCSAVLLLLLLVVVDRADVVVIDMVLLGASRFRGV